MILEPGLYLACFAVAATISFFLTPLVRLLSLRLGLLDAPISAVKTMSRPPPFSAASRSGRAFQARCCFCA